MENKKGKFYICLDRPEYTVYIDEQEVLLQAGLVAQIESVEEVNHGEITIFNLYISDEMVGREQKKRTRDYVIPLILYGVQQIYLLCVRLVYNYFKAMVNDQGAEKINR